MPALPILLPIRENEEFFPRMTETQVRLWERTGEDLSSLRPTPKCAVIAVLEDPDRASLGDWEFFLHWLWERDILPEGQHTLPDAIRFVEAFRNAR